MSETSEYWNEHKEYEREQSDKWWAKNWKKVAERESEFIQELKDCGINVRVLNESARHYRLDDKIDIWLSTTTVYDFRNKIRLGHLDISEIVKYLNKQ